jgi:hypothetical protein
MTLECAQDEHCNVDAFFPVPGRRLDFRIYARGTAARTAKSLDHVQFLFERCDTEPAERRGKALREDHRAVGMPALVYIERSEFRQAEIPHVVPTVVTVAGWKSCVDIGNAVEMYVVQHYKLVVCCDDNVLLEEIRAHAERKSLGFQRVLGQIAGRAAMGDDEWFFVSCLQFEDLAVSAAEPDTGALSARPPFRENQ